MPCGDCAGIRAELLSVREFMAQWFNILIEKIESVEQRQSQNQNTLISKLAYIQKSVQKPEQMVSSSCPAVCRDQLNSLQNRHQLGTGEVGDSVVAPTYHGFRFNAAELGFKDNKNKNVNNNNNCSLSANRRQKRYARWTKKSTNDLTWIKRESSVLEEDNSNNYNRYNAKSLFELTAGPSRESNFTEEEEGRVREGETMINGFCSVGENNRNSDMAVSGTENISSQSISRRSTKTRGNISTGGRKKAISIEEEGRFTCRQCHSSFTQISNLRRHVKVIHQGLTKHTCGYCGKVFAWKGAWRRHEQFVHESRHSQSFQNINNNNNNNNSINNSCNSGTIPPTMVTSTKPY